MRRLALSLVSACVVCAAMAPSAAARAQSLTPIRASGQSVTPVFEGWYRNPDGTYSIAFGYFNRNANEPFELPAGADNNISPGPANQGQPTHFQPRRHWGAFAITVPANFGRNKVVWTLRNRGESFAIPGSLDPLWEIDALEGEASTGNRPPVLRFTEAGPESRGPGGGPPGNLRATAGVAIDLSVWAQDDGKVAAPVTAGRPEIPMTLTWIKHQGPGDVTFMPATARVPNAGGKATTSAMFSKPGEYILRVRANDAVAMTTAGHAQCCWTNGFIKVSVTP